MLLRIALVLVTQYNARIFKTWELASGGMEFPAHGVGDVGEVNANIDRPQYE